MECTICYTVKRKGFTCPVQACAVWTCLDCYTKSLDTCGLICMSCTAPLPENRWYDLFPKGYVNTHIEKRATTELFHRFRAQLPTVQDGAESEIRARRLRVDHGAAQAVVWQKRKALDEAETLAGGLWREISRCEAITRGDEGVKSGPPIERVYWCITTGCNAYLDKNMHCGVCGVTFCASCHEPAHDGADGKDCSPDKVANVQYLKRHTRACPTCATPIQKSEGCDQMFCVVPDCNTFFSYTSGKKITSGPLHNPHYVERLRMGGVVPLNMAPVLPAGCDGLPDLRVIQRAINPAPRIWDPVYRSVLNFHRSITHIAAEVDRGLTPPAMREHMINFLLGNRINAAGIPYTQADFLSDLKKKWKAYRRKTDERVVLATCRDVARDLFNHFIQAEPAELVELSELYQRLTALAGLTNAELVTIAEHYANKPGELFVTDESNSFHLDFRRPALVGHDPWARPEDPERLNLLVPQRVRA